MKRHNKGNSQSTPIKKGLHASPMDKDLAIYQSDDSQSELFEEILGKTPSFHGDCSPFSFCKSQSKEEQDSYYSFTESDNGSSENQDTVKDLKKDQPKTSQRLPLAIIDTNRKGCNCRHSKCDKNYCDCLRFGSICVPGICSCQDCKNTQEKKIHQINKQKVLILTQAPKGCNCRKNKCLKKYCECHNGGRKCGQYCQCVDCHNKDENENDDRESPFMMGSKLVKLN